MKVVGIYGLRCVVTGKWYVGQSLDIQSRMGDYRNLRCKNQRKLYYALKKYGYDGFEKSIIETCDPVEWILDYREMYWIRHLNSVENGYNLSVGGRSNHGCKHTDEWKRRMSEIMKTRVITAEHCANISRGLRGRKLSETTRKKIGDCHRNNESFREKMRIVAKNRPPMSEESRRKCSIASRKKGPTSEDTKEKLRQAALRRGPISDTHRENLRVAAKSRPKASTATCEKRRLAALKRWHPSQALASSDDT